MKDVMFVNLKETYQPGMSSLHLYDAARGAWHHIKRETLEKVRWVVAVFEGEVKEVYRPDCWLPAGTTPYLSGRKLGDTKDRWEFVGAIDWQASARYVGMTVKSIAQPLPWSLASSDELEELIPGQAAA